MAEWYIWVITILGALVIFGGSGGYVLLETRREIKGKVKVEMRTLTGESDDFLTKIQGDFIVMPESRRKYLDVISNEYGIKNKGIEPSYIFDSRAVIKDYYPSKKGWLSILSAPIDKISYNEGDPLPIPRIAIDEYGNLKRPNPIDSAAIIALSKDESFMASIRLMGDEMEGYRKQALKFADKYVPRIVHYIHIFVTFAMIGVTIYGAMYIINEIKTIKDGLGL